MVVYGCNCYSSILGDIPTCHIRYVEYNLVGTILTCDRVFDYPFYVRHN